MSAEVQRILNDSCLDPEERTLVSQIIDNMYTRGLILDSDSLDETIATTECIVLTNCLRRIWQERQKQGIEIPCQHDWNNGDSGLSGNRIFTCSKCGKTEIDD